MNYAPIVGITMGDGAGIGPEVIVKAIDSMANKTSEFRPLVIGDLSRLKLAAEICGSKLSIRAVRNAGEAKYLPGELDVLNVEGLPENLPFGRLSPDAGEAAYQYVVKAVTLALDGEVDAICTAPLNKEALHAAGRLYPGHTELLADLTGVPEVSMVLSTDKIKVIHVTTHVGLLDAIERIDADLVYRTIKRGQCMLQDAGVARPSIAVCGINPHAGENGLFGRGEEEEKIVPAVERARHEGIDVLGPLAADTVFFRASEGQFDLVVAMYHDQGHAPVKILGLHAGVNVTVGLPVIRTSVDHGTAFDIAGTGNADERSMLEALRQASVLAPRR